MKIDHNLSSFRIMRKEIAQIVSGSSNYDIILDIMVGWVTNRIGYRIVAHERAEGSNYTLLS